MNKLRIYVSLIFGLINVFLLGVYTNGTREIQTYQWALTSFFALYFLGRFLQEYRKKGGNPPTMNN
tara:strand:- start:4418 stop:4615 length:198 start_codon:yes stop_codon:yes gene_type:complete